MVDFVNEKIKEFPSPSIHSKVFLKDLSVNPPKIWPFSEVIIVMVGP
jgi:hypothetical protein